MATILVLDDDQSLLGFLEHALELAGHKVITAVNGMKAIRIVEIRQVDLLLTDIFMPDKEGLETIAEVRTRHPNLPIIAMSGGGQNELGFSLETAQQVGANVALVKPFTLDQVTDAIDLALAKN